MYCPKMFIINKQFNMNQFILEESCEPNMLPNNRTKLQFLQSEKVRLQVAVREMQQQIKLQRAINLDLVKGSKEIEIVQQLRFQNGVLQGHYLRIKNENEELASNLLIHQQLMDSNQLELAASLKSYQQKIIELRRSIQHKESTMQTLQSRLKLSQDRIITPSTNVTLLFFNQIEQLKAAMSKMGLRNRQLEFQNSSLLIKNEQLVKKMQLIQSLTLKSQLTYQQFKHYYRCDNQKMRSSAPKKGVYIPLKERLTQLANQKASEIQITRECSQESSLPIDSSIKMLVYKYHLQLQKTKAELSKIKESYKYQRKAKSSIAQSYSQLQNKLNQTMSELNYYKKSTQDLVKMMTYKRQLCSRSLQKSKEERIINRINIPNQITYVSDRKKYWKNVQSGIKIQKIKLLQVKRQYNKMHRSLSCIIDYRRMQVDEVDKYLNKKSNNKQKQAQKQRRLMETKESMDDFSKIIDGPFQEDFSIIQSVSKKSYAQWKKSNQKKNVFNLTVIEENIL